nr:PASTA domain-containing protein [Paeniglutamicibacter psychrophenolicus]
MIEVPNMQGKQLREARETLEGLGFKVTDKKALGGLFGTVHTQTPAGGTAPEGSIIHLLVI